MRWPRTVICASAWLLATSLPLARAEDNTLQYQYLKIYLKINDAFQLEKQGNLQGALIDFKDSYTRLQKIHNTDPNWESALVMGRMNDCRSKIIELSGDIAAQGGTATVPASSGGGTESTAPTASGGSADVEALKQKLSEVEQELTDLKAKYQNSQLEVTTLRASLDSVNQELTTLKSEHSGDNQVGRLMTQNKELTDKLAAAEKEITSIKSGSPKSTLSLLRVQLKNSQDALAASEASNAALQQTTTTLTQQLDDAQSDLRSANQKLASAPTNSPDYLTLKRENEVMREILTRELQEQAHRDMAKRLAQEEFDRLRITSKVLQEQLDILGSPMTPPTSEQERALLDSLRNPIAQVTPVPPEGGNTFAAPANPGGTNVATTATAPSTTTGNSGGGTPSTDTAANSTPTVPATTPPLTNQALTQADNSVPAVTPTPPSTVTPAGTPETGVTPASTNSVASSNPPPASSDTNVVAATPTTSASPSTSDNPTNTPPAAVASTPTTNSATAPDASTNTASANPPSTQSVATASSGATTNAASGTTNNAPAASDTTEYSSKPRLPTDMRDTAQQAADLFKMQRYDDAAAKYQEIIDKYPESLYAWSNLGVVRFQQGKMPEALKALQRAVSLSPTDAFSYQNLGIVYYQMGQYENAISALERALALDPTNAKSHNYLGCACSQKGWSEVAEKEFLKAIEIDDSFGDAHFNLALVYATEKPPALEMARRHYKRALELGIGPDPRLEKLLQMDGVAQNPPANDQR